MEITKANLKALAARLRTQRALAEALGQEPSYINQLITGKRPISEKTARGFEDALGLEPKALDHPGLRNMLKSSESIATQFFREGEKVTFKGLKMVYGIDSDNIREAIMILLNIMTATDKDSKMAKAIELIELGRIDLRQPLSEGDMAQERTGRDEKV